MRLPPGHLGPLPDILWFCVFLLSLFILCLFFPISYISSSYVLAYRFPTFFPWCYTVDDYKNMHTKVMFVELGQLNKRWYQQEILNKLLLLCFLHFGHYTTSNCLNWHTVIIVCYHCCYFKIKLQNMSRYTPNFRSKTSETWTKFTINICHNLVKLNEMLLNKNPCIYFKRFIGRTNFGFMMK